MTDGEVFYISFVVLVGSSVHVDGEFLIQSFRFKAKQAGCASLAVVQDFTPSVTETSVINAVGVGVLGGAIRVKRCGLKLDQVGVLVGQAAVCEQFVQGYGSSQAAKQSHRLRGGGH